MTARVPDTLFNLGPVPTEQLVAELGRRGIELKDLPWEDCGECAHVRGLKEVAHVITCGAKRTPTYFPDGPSGSGDPHEVGFYALACPSRLVEPRAGA